MSLAESIVTAGLICFLLLIGYKLFIGEVVKLTLVQHIHRGPNGNYAAANVMPMDNVPEVSVIVGQFHKHIYVHTHANRSKFMYEPPEQIDDGRDEWLHQVVLTKYGRGVRMLNVLQLAGPRQMDLRIHEYVKEAG
jgi:hypothetical protein